MEKTMVLYRKLWNVDLIWQKQQYYGKNYSTIEKTIVNYSLLHCRQLHFIFQTDGPILAELDTKRCQGSLNRRPSLFTKERYQRNIENAFNNPALYLQLCLRLFLAGICVSGSRDLGMGHCYFCVPMFVDFEFFLVCGDKISCVSVIRARGCKFVGKDNPQNRTLTPRSWLKLTQLFWRRLINIVNDFHYFYTVSPVFVYCLSLLYLMMHWGKFD